MDLVQTIIFGVQALATAVLVYATLELAKHTKALVDINERILSIEKVRDMREQNKN